MLFHTRSHSVPYLLSCCSILALILFLYSPPTRSIFSYISFNIICARFPYLGERYDFVINADQPVGAYWIQARGLGECGIRRVQQLGILRYARGPYQPTTNAPTYDVGLPQGVVSIISIFACIHIHFIFFSNQLFFIDRPTDRLTHSIF